MKIAIETQMLSKMMQIANYHPLKLLLNMAKMKIYEISLKIYA